MEQRQQHQQHRRYGSIWRVCCVFILAITLPGLVQADDTPQIVLKMRSVLESGKLNDGTRLGVGRIVFHEDHYGFQIWSDAVKSTDQPHRYVLAGEQNLDHKLHVRLEGDGWQSDIKDGKGIILTTSDDMAKFDVRVDGEQAVVADRYQLQINGMALLP
ncbi:AfaD family invasin [Serratia sp. 2723]|uniref:AfaD family invasin n=1 Tax=unclassified Serratia (in: enterobacteria) TaxID=2647522 RepID=UPI003D23B4FA